MNEVQVRYLKLDDKWNGLLKAEKYDEAEALEDEILVAEDEMVNWMFNKMESSGIDGKTVATLRNDWQAYPERVLQLALKFRD